MTTTTINPKLAKELEIERVKHDRQIARLEKAARKALAQLANDEGTLEQASKAIGKFEKATAFRTEHWPTAEALRDAIASADDAGREVRSAKRRQEIARLQEEERAARKEYEWMYS